MRRRAAPPLASLPGGQHPPAPVVELRLMRRKLRHERCGHWHILIDPDLPVVVCQDCTAPLDPIEVLRRYASHAQQLSDLRTLLETHGIAAYVTCDHCGERTRAVRMPHEERR